MRVGLSCGIWVGAGVGWRRAQRSPTCGVTPISQHLISRNGNNRICLNYPIIAFEIFRGKRWASLREASTYDLVQHAKLNFIS